MWEDELYWGLSNPGPDMLHVWLEPWAEEIAVPARSAVILKSSAGSDDRTIGEFEWTSDCLVVWANVRTLEAFIDGVRQETCSATIAVPDELTKGMLNILFAEQPIARLGGARADTIERTSWWIRLRLLLGL
ncbi:hypothetical protein TomTYG45_12440 [Sphingobium sp. TomTYG45]